MPKRVNFVSIQQSHTVPAAGYHQAYVQTGYEQVLPYRTSKLFAYMAEEDGVVKEITPNYIVVVYKSGKIVNANLGRQYGKAEGSVYPHDIRTDLAVNSKFKAGDPIAYNTGFFERDFYDPTKILYKGGLSVKTLLMESSQTHEDSSSISEKVSRALTTKTTKIKSYTLEFKQGVRNLVKIGQVVKPDDILFYIENESTANTDIFDDKSIEILKRISSQAPRAKVNAVVDRIEMFYHGDKEDMSPSIRQLADLCDKGLKSREGASLGKNVSGQVDQDYRVAGKPLLLDTAEFRIYLTSENKAAIGDKGVFANQMKSVMGEVIDYDLHTERGEEIDAIFGFRSISARIVLSPLILGTTTTLLKFIAKKAVSIYKGKS